MMGKILPTHFADILDKAIETEDEYSLSDGSTDKMSTDDENDEEPDCDTSNDSD